MNIDFEGIESKVKSAANNNPEWESIVHSVSLASEIFLLGNGGLHYVASHLATDMTRLIEGKTFYSFDSVGFITSNANDHGFNNVFVKWLEVVSSHKEPSSIAVLGMSCSGASTNVINALDWASSRGSATHLISGVRPYSGFSHKSLVLGCEFFHTVEVSCLMLLYELIYRCGSTCPSIQEEISRCAHSNRRVLSPKPKEKNDNSSD